LNSKILDYLESTTLDELVKTQRNKSENQSIEFATNKNNSESNKIGAF
jgi:DNA-binding IscR family transcriptional regulator